ncbi:uncharacterized protein BJ171DRAFT_254553 [Polychytrium aggregatum]|uniref:uncharacterized protein n=1 Tax=Polychytrium aggregatum TaxID=110093 RepID=UPI0022FDE6EF|nr:uncharacterized protein BJ171DRAFT_254553 [Polychytrium aggregatum]KAI9207742.1 hypothetical protein BJ171DRAFT_254553 [Polychytrium aggregatum]
MDNRLDPYPNSPWLCGQQISCDSLVSLDEALPLLRAQDPYHDTSDLDEYENEPELSQVSSSTLSETLSSTLCSSPTEPTLSPQASPFAYLKRMLSQSYRRTFRLFEHSAEMGNVEAQYKLAMCYMKGHGIHRNFDEAFHWLTKAAQHNHVEAQATLGECFEDGLGTLPDLPRALYWYSTAALNGSALSMTNLARCYELGLGTAPNAALSLEWYRKAALLGSRTAIVKYAVALLAKRGLDLTQLQSLDWFRKSASVSEAESRYRIGLCYKDGKSIPRDLHVAAEHFTMAALAGHADAHYELGLLYLRDFPPEGHDPTLAVRHLRIAAERGHSYAQEALAECLEAGLGLSPDLDQALAWYRLASDQGCIKAMKRLAELLQEHSPGQPRKRSRQSLGSTQTKPFFLSLSRRSPKPSIPATGNVSSLGPSEPIEMAPLGPV